MNSLFEKIFLTLVLAGTALLLFGLGNAIGEWRMKKSMQASATQHCGAKFDELTGDFAWTVCPPFMPEPAVVTPDPNLEETVALTEAIPVETPSEPVH